MPINTLNRHVLYRSLYSPLNSKNLQLNWLNLWHFVWNHAFWAEIYFFENVWSVVSRWHLVHIIWTQTYFLPIHWKFEFQTNLSAYMCLWYQCLKGIISVKKFMTVAKSLLFYLELRILYKLCYWGPVVTQKKLINGTRCHLFLCLLCIIYYLKQNIL